MGKIDKTTRSELYKLVTVGNLRRQFDLLRDLVTVGTQCDFKINLHIVMCLHSTVAAHLVEDPGQYRTEPARIEGSPHEPPDSPEIAPLMRNYIVSIHERWNTQNEYILAAYSLWRLLWIHPFEDCNGRTARAVAYLVICLKQKRWLPGENNLMSLIKDTSEEYTKALRYADEIDQTDDKNIIPLALYLAKLTNRQIKYKPAKV